MRIYFFVYRVKSLKCLPSLFTYSCQTIGKTRHSFNFAESCPISSLDLCNFKFRNCFGLRMKVLKSYVAPQKRYLYSIPFKFGDFLGVHCSFSSICGHCSHRGIVERHVQCAQSPMHLVESAAPSGSSRLHSSMNFRSRNQ